MKCSINSNIISNHLACYLFHNHSITNLNTEIKIQIAHLVWWICLLLQGDALRLINDQLRLVGPKLQILLLLLLLLNVMVMVVLLLLLLIIKSHSIIVALHEHLRPANLWRELLLSCRISLGCSEDRHWIVDSINLLVMVQEGSGRVVHGCMVMPGAIM